MMRVLGKTPTGEAYRIGMTLEDTEVIAQIPEALLSAEHGRASRVPHQMAYEWIEDRARPLARAIRQLHTGAPVRAPYDQITLEPARL